MILGIFVGISIGLCLASLWRFLEKLVFAAKNENPIDLDEAPKIRMGPFLHKKPKAKKKPISNTDQDVALKEMRNNGEAL